MKVSVRFWTDPLVADIPFEYRSKGLGNKIVSKLSAEPKDFKTNFTIGDIVLINNINKKYPSDRVKGRYGVVWKSKDSVPYPDIVCFGEEAIPLVFVSISLVQGKISLMHLKYLLETLKNLKEDNNERYYCILCKNPSRG